MGLTQAALAEAMGLHRKHGGYDELCVPKISFVLTPDRIIYDRSAPTRSIDVEVFTFSSLRRIFALKGKANTLGTNTSGRSSRKVRGYVGSSIVIEYSSLGFIIDFPQC
jgi:hypothetical protein